MNLRALLFTCCLGTAALGLRPGAAAETPDGSARATTAPVPPPLPAVKSPVAYFRTLLAMDTTGREQALGGRTAAQKQQILAKLQEYEALAPDERELRLRVVEFQWYLSPLLRVAPAPRAERLATIPEPQRQWVEQRLRDWDGLPAAEQQDILDHERALAYVVSFGAGGPPAPLPAAARDKLEADLARWRLLPGARRQQMLGNFQKYFERPEHEQQQALKALSPEERQQMEQTLVTFAKLPPALRKTCLDSFGKFAGLSRAERDQFLRNAERWQAMTPAERETWRKLVHQLPPLPPGFGMPPLPPKNSSLPLAAQPPLTNR